MAANASDNARWLSRSRAAVWHPCTQMKMHETVPLARALDEAYVYPTLETVQDRRYPLSREVYFYTNRPAGGATWMSLAGRNSASMATSSV